MLDKGSLFLKKKKKSHTIYEGWQGVEMNILKMNTKMVLSIPYVHPDLVFNLTELRHIRTRMGRILHASVQMFSQNKDILMTTTGEWES